MLKLVILTWLVVLEDPLWVNILLIKFLRPNLKNLSRSARTWLVPLRIVFIVARFEPVLNWNRFLLFKFGLWFNFSFSKILIYHFPAANDINMEDRTGGRRGELFYR